MFFISFAHAQLSRELGPIFSFWFGGRRVIVVNDFNSVNELLLNDVFADRPHRTTGSIINKTFTGEFDDNTNPPGRVIIYRHFKPGKILEFEQYCNPIIAKYPQSIGESMPLIIQRF